MYADIFADRAPIFTPICIPVRTMACAIFAFMSPLLPTASELLPIGDFTIHEPIPSPPEKVAEAQVEYMVTRAGVESPTKLHHSYIRQVYYNLW